MILVTGGAGFIGANFVLDWLRARRTSRSSISTSSPTRATPPTYASLADDRRHVFVRGDIARSRARRKPAARGTQPRAIVHFAAESHVDRSIHGPDDFIETNVVGTLQRCSKRARASGRRCRRTDARRFRFLHVSTDEVYGSLGPTIPRSPKRPRTRRTARTPRRKRLRSPRSRVSPHLRAADDHDRTAPTTTDRSSFPKSSSRSMIVNALEPASRCRCTATGRTCATGCTFRSLRRDRVRTPARQARRDLQRRRRRRARQYRRRHLDTGDRGRASSPAAPRVWPRSRT